MPYLCSGGFNVGTGLPRERASGRGLDYTNTLRAQGLNRHDAIIGGQVLCLLLTLLVRRGSPKKPAEAK